MNRFANGGDGRGRSLGLGSPTITECQVGGSASQVALRAMVNTETRTGGLWRFKASRRHHSQMDWKEV